MKKTERYSINTFRKESKMLDDFIMGTYAIIRIYKMIPLINMPKNIKDELDKFTSKYSDQMDFNQKRIDKLYELGFLSLFATFECFMYEFLREQYSLFPN